VTISLFLSRLGSLALLLLDRAGVSGRLAAIPLPLALDERAPWLVALLTSALVLLFAALASGPDERVRVFRALGLLTGTAIPVAALRLIPTPNALSFLGVAILVALSFAAIHRLLTSHRGRGSASRAIERTHRLIETLGLALFSLGLFLVLFGARVPLALAFWSLFLLQLSMANRIGPSRLAESTGLKDSAVADLKKAVAPRKGKRRSTGRAGSLAWAAGKFLLVGIWLLLPLGAALAHREVALGEWPERALWLRFYPAVALAAAALLLMVESIGALKAERLAALRGIVLSTAAGLYLLKVYGDPAFAAYRGSIPGAYFAGTLLAFLLGAAESGRSRRNRRTVGGRRPVKASLRPPRAARGARPR
jgi:hypothetical protein